MHKLNLSHPCDACGRTPTGNGAICLKCNIYYCNLCQLKLYFKTPPEKQGLTCPMCGSHFDINW